MTLIKAYKKQLIAFSLIIAVTLFFQNCGGGDGTTVENPLREDKILKVGFTSYTTMAEDLTVGLCIEKVIIEVDEFYEDVDPQPNQPVGYVRDVASNEVGEVHPYTTPDDRLFLYSTFKSGESRSVVLDTDMESIVYELDIPNGKYKGTLFMAFPNGTGGCNNIGGHSLVVENTFGEFYTDRRVELLKREEFEVRDNMPSKQTIESQPIIDNVGGVQSNEELDEVITNFFRANN
jgi:hypothetical protein